MTDQRWNYWRYRLLVYLLVFASIPFSPMPSYAQSAVAAPQFSVAHGLFTNSFQLTLSSATSGAQIRYTTNFTTPTPSNGTVYNGPITIAQTTIVRAIAYTSSSNKSATVTQSYIFVAAVRNQNNSPGAGWPTTFAASNSDGGPYPAYYEMAPEIVNHANNTNRIEEALRSLPTISFVTDLPNLWDPTTGIYYNPNEKGSAWERPASLEWIDPTGATLGFTENSGVRIHGQATRRPHRTPKKTFRFYFTAQYGNTKLDFKLFDENDPVAKFDRILVRGGGNRSWPYFDRDQRRETDYINDEFVRRAFLEMGGLAGHGTFAHLYINGQYWGLYNVTERMDGRFLVGYLGGVETDYDLIAPDEENNYVPTADPGTIDAWNSLHSLLNVSTVSDSLYDQVKQRLDVVDLADYIILLHYDANTDWPAHNWYAYRKRSGADTRFHMIPWDSDTGLNNLNENMTLADAPSTPARLFLKLITNVEFKQLVADRFYKWLVNGNGALTPAACNTRYSQLANLVDPAVITESARWGAYARKIYPQINFSSSNKALPAYYYSRDMPAADADPGNQVSDSSQKTWLQVRDAKLNTYCPQRTGVVINQYVSNGWYQTSLKPPSFSQEGGAVAAGYNLTISNSPNSNAGDIFYTTNGADPRAPGGAVAANAVNGADSANVTINQVTTVLARVRNGTSWSPLHEATFYPPQPLTNLVINEIHYNPTAATGVDPDDFEFIELYNKGNVALRLDNVHFSRGFSYRFPLNATLAAGAFVVLSPNAAQFKARYGVDPYGVMRGNLSNGGEAIELVDAVNNSIDLVDYKDVAPWPTSPDGTGPSLALCNPTLDNSQAANWSVSAQNNGTPGLANGLSCGGSGNTPPTVSITAPLNNASFMQGAQVTINATASDSNGNVTQVVFYDNNNAIPGCTDTSSPYSCTFTPGVGNHALTTIATDNGGATTTSAAVNITVNAASNLPPSVSISSPANNASFVEGAQVTVNATASDSDGNVTGVVFYDNGNAIPGCTDNTSPYSCTFTPSVGGHALTAVATDNGGASTTSAPAVNITVTPAGGGSGAFIEQNGQVVMEAEHFANKIARSNHDWQQVTAPSGAVGGAAMSALPNVALNIQTSIESTSPQMNYEVQFSQTGLYNVWVRANATSGSDDSLHVGLDGAAKATISTGYGSWQWKKASTTINVATAGLHTFNIWMREDGVVVDRIILSKASTTPSGDGPAESPRGAGGNQAPTVSITAPANNASFTQNAVVAIQATANDSDGTVTRVVFYDNGSPIANCSDTTAPFECAFTPAVGSHALTAIATDNGNASTTSAAVNITVNPSSNVPPSVNITSPANNAPFNQGDAVTIVANASDSDGTIMQVVFRDNGTAIANCTISAAPYQCVFTPTAGSHALTAVATDNGGASTTSTTVNITVNGGGGSGAFLESGGQVVFEAEHFSTMITRSNHSWSASTAQTGFGGEAAMWANPNNGANIQSNVPTTSPEMQYPVQFVTAGTYYLWTRTWALGGSDDSLHVGMDGQLKVSPSVAYASSWLWTKKTFGTVTAGLHTINVWMREDGVTLDRVILTTNASFTPSGVGPIESPRGATVLNSTPSDTMLADASTEGLFEGDSIAAGTESGAPLVWLVAPEGDLSEPSGSLLTFAAMASQIANSETQVLFYANGQLISGCDVSSAPYECTWSPPLGVHAITAVAFGEYGQTVSAPIVVTIFEESAEAQEALLQRGYLPLIVR